RRAADRRLALAAAVRVVHRVHDRTAHRGTASQPTGTPGFALVDQFVILVAHGADGRAAFFQHAADFAGGEADDGVLVFLAEQLRLRAGGAHQLPALAGLQLDVVDHGADGDVFQRQRVAD